MLKEYHDGEEVDVCCWQELFLAHEDLPSSCEDGGDVR